MADSRDLKRPRGAWLGSVLPGRVRREVFEPALHDLHIAATSGQITKLAHLVRVSFLVLDCWRVATFPARTPWSASLPTTPRRTSLKGLSQHMLQEVRYAIRRLAHDRGFTAAAVLTLTLGVGANVAVFAVIEAVLLRPLPYVEADELAILNHRDDRTGITKEFIAVGDFIDMAARQTAFANFAAFNRGRNVIYGEGDPIVADSLHTGPGFIEALRVTPVHGRFANDADARQGAAPVVVLGHALWQRSFGANRDVVGRRIRVGTVEREIVGIAPPGFEFPPGRATDLIFPYALPATAPAERKSSWQFTAARLSSGQTFESANTQLTALSRQMENEHPTQNQGSRYFVTSLRDGMVGETKKPLTLLAFAVGAVLLIACANVGNLLLVRSLGRQQEMAVRAALGASRARMTGQVLAESFVLALASAAGGLAVAYWGTPALVALVPESVNAPGLAEAGLNLKVLGFALGIATAAALMFGLVSAMTSGRASAGALASTSVTRAGISRSARRLTSSLVVVEVALAVVLLLGAGLILRSFASLMSVDPGFNVDRVVTFDMALPAGRYRDAPARGEFYQRASAALRAAPGIEHAGMAAVTPLTGNNWTAPFERADRPAGPGERPPDVGWQNASGGYFQALGIPLKSGRLFDERDGPGSAPVVIVSEAIARRFFTAGESAVGHFVKQGNTQMEIVGVVGDIRRAALTDEPRMDMYFPFERQPGNGTTMFVRTTGDSTSALPGIQAALKAVEPNVVMTNSGSLAETAAQSVGTTRLTLWLLAVFAAIALALAGIGIYGVLAHAVRQRRREIGTRLALGARPHDILWLVMRWGTFLAVIGLALGAGVGLLAARSLESMLFGVAATDLPALAGAGAALLLTALAASFVPARRAAATDPAKTLTNA